MNKQNLKRVVHIVSVAAFVFALAVMPALAQQVRANSLMAAADIVGYVDHSYGTAVKVEPTADTTESKLWFNDGFWWAVMFNPTSVKWEIYKLDWATQVWNSTGFEVDTRYETGDLTQVATRHDVLWDEAAGKLYIASHIRVLNASRVNSFEQRGQLFRYSYNTASDTYTLDANFPAEISNAKSEALVIEKDATGRLWSTFVSRIPTSDPLDVEPYKVYVNASAANEYTWNANLDMTTVTGDTEAAWVSQMDIASVVAFNDMIGVMWSNMRTGKFYFATHPNTSDYDEDWTITEVAVAGVPLSANDHIKLVADNGRVFAAIKTSNTNNGEPLVGLLSRDSGGTWHFASFSPVESQDTRPSLAYNKDTNTLYMFATSNATGGVVCVKSTVVPADLATLSFPPGSCTTSGGANDAPLFIADTVVDRIDNLTTTKRPVTNASGVLGLASDDPSGSLYVHNFIGGVVAPLTLVSFTPADGATVNASFVTVTASFNKDMNPATFTPANFQVTGPGGAIAGTYTYNDVTRTVTFTSAAALPAGTHTIEVDLTSGIEDAGGAALTPASWSFTQVVAAVVQPAVQSVSPADGATIASDMVTINVIFNKEMDPTTITAANFVVTGPSGLIAGTFSYNNATRTATFAASTPLPIGTHLIEVELTSGIKDSGGMALTPYNWSFTQEVSSGGATYYIYMPVIFR